MITSDQELEATLERIGHFQAQVAHLRKVETNPTNYHFSASGFLAEIDRMQLESVPEGQTGMSGPLQKWGRHSCLPPFWNRLLEVREYLSVHPAELATSAS